MTRAGKGGKVNLNPVIQRARALLLSPRTEWPVIAAEPATVADLYRRYILIVAAIPPVCGFIKSCLLGYGWQGFQVFRLGIAAGISQAVVGYAVALAVVYVVALIIDALAPTFAAQQNRVQALKVAAYSYTASWVAGIGLLLPLGLSVVIALAGAGYSIYLLYLGLPATMKVSADRAGGYTAVTMVVAIILGWLTALIVGGVIPGPSLVGAYG